MTKCHLSCPIYIRITQQKKDGVCVAKLILPEKQWDLERHALVRNYFFKLFLNFLSPSAIPAARKRGIKDISQKKKVDFQFLLLLWPINNMFLLKKAYFYLSSLNCTNCFLTKETTTHLIMKGSYLCEDQYKLKSYILRCPDYNH